MEYSNKFGQRVKELRDEKELTQKQLAKFMNVNQTTIHYWETRNDETDYTTLCRLAEFFGVSVGYLLGVEEFN